MADTTKYWLHMSKSNGHSTKGWWPEYKMMGKLEPFSVTNGTKQGCVMAPLLFTLVFSAMFNDAFNDNDLG